MTVTCPECRSVFRVDPAKVPVSGVRARCAVCGGLIAIAGGTLPVTVSHEAPVGVRATTAGLAAGSGRAAGAFEATTAATAAGAVAVAPVVPPVAVSPAPVLPVSGPPDVVPPVAVSPAPVLPVSGLPDVVPPIVPPIAPPIAPPVVPLVVPLVVPPVVPPAVVPRQPTPAYTDIPVAFPVFGRTNATPAAVPVVSAAVPVVAPGVPSPAPPAALREASPGPQAMGGAPPALAGSGARVSINPFLRADPDTRARRLARALVSDLVAYHPQRREEGVREGTLRQLFRDDIRKSYEEYVEQVGREVAEQSRHFQDALNDILAGGRALF
jgi:predicted Zn finger-like uncharacterized protein